VSDSIATPTNEDSSFEPAPKKKSAWMIGLGILVALGIAGAGWAVLYGPNGSALDTSTDGSGSSDEASRAVESTRTIEDTSTVVIEPEGGDSNPEYDPNADPALVEQYTAIITDVKESGGAYVITVDYVQFVMGDEAKKAAEANGDTVSANGLYIVNDNPLTRERPVASGLSVRVTIDEAGKPSELGRTLPFADWADAFDGPQAKAYQSGTYSSALSWVGRYEALRSATLRKNSR